MQPASWDSCSSRSRGDRRGVTLAELLVSIGIIGLLLSLLLPAVQSARERSRTMTCRHQLKQLAIAAHNYETAHRTFPYTSTTWFDSTGRRHYPVSAHRSMAGFLDEGLGRKVDFNDPTDPGWTASGSPFFFSHKHRELQGVRTQILGCPSDGLKPGSTSYRSNVGISVQILPPSPSVESTSQKGAFVNGRGIPLSEFRDGLSHTALFCERVLGDFDPAQYDPYRDLFSDGQAIQDTAAFVLHCRNDATIVPASEFSFSGGSWLLGGFLNTWYSHVLLPNSPIPDCSIGPAMIDGGPGIVSARSFHTGGVNVVNADASVRFTSDRINDTVWRAAGTRNLGEVASFD